MRKNSARAQNDNIIHNKSIRAASKRRSFTVAVVIFLVIALLLTGTVWGTISFIDHNSMRIYVNRRNVGTISLSETRDFNSPSSVLRMKGPEEMNNTTYDRLTQRNTVLDRDGNHHESDFIVYSFYLRNVGDAPLLFTQTMRLSGLSRDVENALRVIVIEETFVDDTSTPVATCYAVKDVNSQPEHIYYDTDDKEEQQPLPLDNEYRLDALLATTLTTPFVGYTQDDDENCVVFEKRDNPLNPQEIRRYTLLVWVEGSDSDCTDSIKGAFVSFEYFFEVTDPDAVV